MHGVYLFMYYKFSSNLEVIIALHEPIVLLSLPLTIPKQYVWSFLYDLCSQ